jgi:hypothetical protein
MHIEHIVYWLEPWSKLVCVLAIVRILRFSQPFAEDYSFMGCATMLFGMYVLTFRRNWLLPSAEYSKRPAPPGRHLPYFRHIRPNIILKKRPIKLQEPCVLYIGRAYRYHPDVAFYMFFKQI